MLWLDVLGTTKNPGGIEALRPSKGIPMLYYEML